MVGNERNCLDFISLAKPRNRIEAEAERRLRCLGFPTRVIK